MTACRDADPCRRCQYVQLEPNEHPCHICLGAPGSGYPCYRPAGTSVPSDYPSTFFAGFVFALAQLAVLYPDMAVFVRGVMDGTDFCPEFPDLSRQTLVDLGADEYDAEQVVACLEGREPEEI